MGRSFDLGTIVGAEGKDAGACGSEAATAAFATGAGAAGAASCAGGAATGFGSGAGVCAGGGGKVTGAVEATDDVPVQENAGGDVIGAGASTVDFAAEAGSNTGAGAGGGEKAGAGAGTRDSATGCFTTGANGAVTSVPHFGH